MNLHTSILPIGPNRPNRPNLEDGGAKTEGCAPQVKYRPMHVAPTRCLDSSGPKFAVSARGTSWFLFDPASPYSGVMGTVIPSNLWLARGRLAAGACFASCFLPTTTMPPPLTQA
jgi:hypothetical protein